MASPRIFLAYDPGSFLHPGAMKHHFELPADLYLFVLPGDVAVFRPFRAISGPGRVFATHLQVWREVA